MVIDHDKSFLELNDEYLLDIEGGGYYLDGLKKIAVDFAVGLSKVASSVKTIASAVGDGFKRGMNSVLEPLGFQ